MPKRKPCFGREYTNWLKQEHHVELLSSYADHYESVAARMKSQFEVSSFWTDFLNALPEYNDEYRVQHALRLIQDLRIQLSTKPYNSFLLKTFRKNIQDNRSWDNPPADGWLLPDTWFSRINDVVRTLLVVRYLDGVPFLAERFKAFCADRCIKSNVILDARMEEGYYAAHLYSSHPFEIPRQDTDTAQITAQVEIQITTQLQEVIRDLMHGYYEVRRQMSKRAAPEDKPKWQWDYSTEEFSANYIGHVLHFIEGKILDIRDRQRGAQQ